MEERRKFRRHRVILGGKIFFHHESSSVDCVIRDLSENGAHLRMESTTSVPDQFDLLINQEEMLYPSEVAWRNMTDIGVRFTGEPKDVHLRKLAR